MIKNQILIILVLFLLQVSCGKNNSLKEASQKLCKCFENYSEDDSELMINSVNLLDSLAVDISNFPKEKLLKQLTKDCPKTASVIIKLAD